MALVRAYQPLEDRVSVHVDQLDEIRVLVRADKQPVDRQAMRYAHLSPDVKRDAVRLLDDVPPRVPSSPAVTAGEGELRSP